MSCRVVKAWAKPVVVRILQHTPPLPTWLWDEIVRRKLGNIAPEIPEVLYVSDSSLGTPAVQIPLCDLPQRQDGFVRIVIISDTHERHRLVQVPAADVLLHCGDILMSSRLARRSRSIDVLCDFNAWLQSLPCEEKVVIGGNHDVALEELEPSDAREVLNAAILLQESSVALPRAGLTVYGNSWSFGASHNRSWQTAEPLISDACHGADVVMSHGCTKEIVDALLLKAQPCLWASGHYHGSHGVKERGGVLFVNAAIMDEHDNPVQPPVVVDLPKGSG